MGISSAIPRLDEQWTEHMGVPTPGAPGGIVNTAQTPYPYTRVSDVFTDYVAHPAVRIHPSPRLLGRLSRRDVALLLREVKRDYLSQYR